MNKELDQLSDPLSGFSRDADLTSWYQRAQSHEQKGEMKDAIACYIQTLKRYGERAPTYLKLGVCLINNKRPDAGLIALKRAAGLAPDDVAILTELGMALKRFGLHAEAFTVLDRALELDPFNIHAAFNKGEMLLRTNRYAEAFAWFDVIVKGDRDANNIKAISRWLRGVALLTMGDYVNAWPDYEARIDHPTTTFPELRGERWVGQPLAGKSIFLAYELRFGDVIQFSRFVPDLVEQGATVYLEIPIELSRLFASLSSQIRLVKPSDPRPVYDYCQLMTSIPAVLGYRREDVWRGQYLRAEPSTSLKRLEQRPGTALKVGVLWAGKPVPNRSIPLAHYVPLLKHREVSFYSFQLGPQRRQMDELSVGWLIDDLSSQISDFHDSSCLMQQMDLLITIDTAAAHQAGALGIPTWLMLIFYSDWRWGAYGDSTTPWYPSIRIFRQQKYDSWIEVAGELEQAFAKWVDEKMRMTESIQDRRASEQQGAG